MQPQIGSETPGEAAGNPFADLAPPAPEQAAMVGPPQTPEDVQNRSSGWTRLFSAIQNDPAVTMGLLKMGTSLMQPIAPGQNLAGHFGNAIDDSVNYVAASRGAEEKRRMDEATNQSQVAERRASTAGKVQEIQQKGAMFPNAMKQAEQALTKATNDNKKADYDLQQLEAQKQAGLMGPDWQQRVAQANQDKVEATTRLYNAHAKYYEMMGDTQRMKADGTRQLLRSEKIENQDGTTTIVNAHAVNGKLYIESYTPPRFTDAGQAQVQAQKDVDKRTPFFGQAPYTGTKAQEVARLTKVYLSPQHSILAPGGQSITPQQFEAVDKPAEQPGTPGIPGSFGAGNAAAATKPLSQSQLGGKASLSPDAATYDASLDQAPANVAELTSTIARTKDPKIKALLQGELDRITAAGGSTTLTPPQPEKGGPIPVKRDSNGRLVIVSDANAGEATPPAPGEPWTGATKTAGKGGVPWQDIPAPPPQQRGSKQWLDWEAKYGTSYDALPPRLQRMVRANKPGNN